MPSCHRAAKALINKKLFDDLDSFRALEDRICALGDENSKAVGDALEIFVEAYLARDIKIAVRRIDAGPPYDGAVLEARPNTGHIETVTQRLGAYNDAAGQEIELN